MFGITPEDESYNPNRTVRCKSKARHRRAFAVLDPGGRTRTGILRMDSSLLFQLSYSGVVPAGVRGGLERRKSLFRTRPSGSRARLRQRSGMTPERMG